MNHKIDFQQILNHLNNYTEIHYKGPERVEGNERERMFDIKSSGSKAANELNKLAIYFANEYDLQGLGKSKWLNGANTQVRSYLWNQLKAKQYQTIPSSMSIFAEKIGDEVRFRLSIELDGKNASVADRRKHHQILERPLIEDPHYSYIISKDSSLTLYESDESRSEIKAKLELNEYKKVQIVYILTHHEIQEQQLSDEQILTALQNAFENLHTYYIDILSAYDYEQNEHPEGAQKVENQQKHALNTILYGPPGTGKTYNTVLYALSIIEEKTLEDLKAENYEEVVKRFNHYKRQNRIVFTTFHQSYGYEEFIEGIKPTLEDDQTQIEYQIQAGVFKDFCEKAQELDIVSGHSHIKSSAQIWKVSLGGSDKPEVKQDCFANERIRIGWDHFGKDYLEGPVEPEGNTKNILNNFYNEMKIGDLVFSLKDQKHIDAIGVIKGEPEWLNEEEDAIQGKNNEVITHYKRSRRVEWLVKDINENIFELNKRKNLTLSTVYKLRRISLTDVQQLLQKHRVHQNQPIAKNEEPYVFIIDEINRGNISKILGELITLIEPSKRMGETEEMLVQLPYSKTDFGVPNNVYILGTMNTADRSIALMDTALRRRFYFTEMMPEETVLRGIEVESIRVEDMLKAINQRIEVLYDREHTIGHAYFIPLQKDPSLKALATIFINSIIPLLQEYFYEDYSKIQMILGDNAKTDDLKFILESDIQIEQIFQGNPVLDLPEKRYQVQLDAFSKVDSYRKIYE